MPNFFSKWLNGVNLAAAIYRCSSFFIYLPLVISHFMFFFNVPVECICRIITLHTVFTSLQCLIMFSLSFMHTCHSYIFFNLLIIFQGLTEILNFSLLSRIQFYKQYRKLFGLSVTKIFNNLQFVSIIFLKGSIKTKMLQF